MKRFSFLINPIISFGIICIIWETAAQIVRNELLIPGIISTASALIEILKEGNTWNIIFSTLLRGVFSFFISFILGATLTALAWLSTFLKILIISIINFLKRVPTIGIIVVSLIWFDVSTAPFVIGIIVTLPLLFEGFMGGIKSISQDYINMAKIYSPTPWKMFKFFYIPLIFIYISPLLSSILSLTFKTVIAGEVLAQLSNSIGGEIFLEKIYLNTPRVFAWIIVVLIFNWLLEVFLKKLNFCCKKLYLII